MRAFLAAPITHPPGSVFLYNSAATYMCSAIVQRVTGQKVIDYLTPKLFTPLGIEGMTWETCPRGINTGGWGLSIQTEGLAKFGQLYLQKGKWNGREIIPAAWVEEATTKHIQQPEPAKPSRPHEDNDWLQGYGYQFWRCRHNAFRGDGAFGQFTIVLPGAGCRHRHHRRKRRHARRTGSRVGAPAARDEGCAAAGGQRGADAPARKLAALALPLPAGQLTSPLASTVSGKTFKLDANDLGLQSAAFTFEKGHCAQRLPRRARHLCHLAVASAHGSTAKPRCPARPRASSPVALRPPARGTRSRPAARGKTSIRWEMIWRYIRDAAS